MSDLSRDNWSQSSSPLLTDLNVPKIDIDDVDIGANYVNMEGSSFDNSSEQPLLNNEPSRSGVWALRFMVLTWIVTTFLFFFYREQISKLIRIIATFCAEQGSLVYLYYILIYAGTVPLLMSTEILTVTAGFIFAHIHGNALGIFISVLTSFIGYAAAMSICFVLARYLIYDFVNRRFRSYRYYNALMSATENVGFKMVSIIRLSPFFPSAICSYIFGTTNVSFRDFFWGSIGYIPALTFYSYAGSLLESLTSDEPVHGWRTVLYISISLVVSIAGMIYASNLTREHLPDV
ncbi:uncharacterized protein TA16150 [Theileria annulata]|uniref:VTT domain-containing protein n=1 Tax=Theileria annulata TaxID=5874 RepID=Q4UIR1_THEAN|nr:uncharacterized protein TA16150 [Theileria annulata]CAI73028.1 hypothetical protein, conserved [Theileria annulata]|eukprot:XP_953706.1 hypothetical protein, conserved [Theileria annulata]